MSTRVRCDLCESTVAPHAHYVLRMQIFADPSMPNLSAEDLEETDFDDTFRKLIEQMKHMSPRELQDQVYKQFEFKLCPRCQREFLINPLGKPRKARNSRN